MSIRVRLLLFKLPQPFPHGDAKRLVVERDGETGARPRTSLARSGLDRRVGKKVVEWYQMENRVPCTKSRVDSSLALVLEEYKSLSSCCGTTRQKKP